MEQEGRASLGASLVRILTVERGGVVPRPEEVERLMDEDPDFSYLAQNWPAERFPLQPRIGAGANSLDELRDEIERLRVFRRHPAQHLRHQIFLSGTVAGVLWAFLSGALEGEELEGSPLVLQGLVVTVALGVGVFFAWGIATRSSREDFYKMLKPDLSRNPWWGLFTIGALLLLILLFATLGFAGITELLYLHDVGTTDPERALDDPLWDSMAFYVWSFLNAIPVLEVPQTLQWNLGFHFTDHVNPVLLLAYKLAVILPAIATARLAWDARRVSRT